MDAWLGTILPVAFHYAPDGWIMAHGQKLRVDQNQGLFSVLLTTYGGDGRTDFGIPDLRGRVPLGFGKGAGSDYPIAASGGLETVALTAGHLPAHAHAATFAAKKSDLTVTIPAQAGDLAITPKLQASSASGSRQVPLAGDMLGASSSSVARFYTDMSTTLVELKGISVSVTGKAATPAASTTLSGVVTDGTVTVAAAGSVTPTALENRMPYLAVNFIVALGGIYPPKP